MSHLSDEQQAIVNAPLGPMAVIACAGSGKTRTAVYRVIEMSKRLSEHRGRVALLSFSNVAVNTFRADFRALSAGRQDIGEGRIEFDTLDGFITANILHPHAYRTMGCSRPPFLVVGTEQFLQNSDYKFWVQPSSGRDFPVQPNELHKVMVSLDAGHPKFHFRQHSALLPINNGAIITTRLGAVGAYTHDLGRYWCYRVMVEQPKLLRALCRRYPHILVDEAQDIGMLHRAMLELLADAGSEISLIGDPNQGIYQFSGADGKFSGSYGSTNGVNAYSLTRNYRSVLPILKIANNFSSRADVADRSVPRTRHGAFFIGYNDSEQGQLVNAFSSDVQVSELSLERSAVLCRANDKVRELTGKNMDIGQGVVKRFVSAAIDRDKHQDYASAFKSVVSCFASLLDNLPNDWPVRVTQSESDSQTRLLRREIWMFVRNPSVGLPSATLQANTLWHQLLRHRVETLLKRLSDEYSLTRTTSVGNKLANKKLPNSPLIPVADLATVQHVPIRITTVHKVKGESLDAVLYLADKKQIDALLAGVHTELGRIGYVAVTRARNLFWLGVPAGALSKLRPKLLNLGFQEIA